MNTPDKKYVPMSVQLKGPLYQIVESYYPKQFKFLIACHSHRVQKESGFSLTTFKCYNLTIYRVCCTFNCSFCRKIIS